MSLSLCKRMILCLISTTRNFFKGSHKKQRKNENMELGCLRAKSLKGAELLRDNNNKTELTNFFCHRIYSSFTPNTVILTKQNNIASIY